MFKYSNYHDENEQKRSFKRMKRETSDDLKELLSKRLSLDRRRLEEAFLLYACVEVVQKYQLHLDHYPFNRNDLAEMICNQFHDSFSRKWGDHVCNEPGCNKVIVSDGNMKNARQVCSCKDTGELTFSSVHGSLVVGCQNTPAKGSRLCSMHHGLALKFQDANDACTAEDEDVLAIVKVLNDKSTRQGKLFEVLWSDGRKSWLKESVLPEKVKQMISESNINYELKASTVHEFGQTRKKLELSSSSTVKLQSSTKELPTKVFSSSGFGIHYDEDNIVVDDDGRKKRLSCGPEKSRHKFKNNRTAGIIVFEKPCSIVVDIKELYGSESKSQVYAHLHNLLQKEVMSNINTLCYDDACHLKRFSQNPVRSGLSDIATRMSGMEMVCDRFHFRNHVDGWCKKNCNPHKCNNLKDVNTEVCEQLFSWLSRFARITKHMNRWRFLFLMLFVLDNHNEYVDSCRKM